MEFEFRKDFITQQATVKLSMGHEAFATWLEQEGQSLVWVEALLDDTLRVQKRNLADIKLVGKEFSLRLNHDEAQVINHSLLNNFDELDLEENFSFYDLESEASCGFDDFVNLLESWMEFISDR
jgi:uncharacterized protein YacL (UPF0231 family)